MLRDPTIVIHSNGEQYHVNNITPEVEGMLIGRNGDYAKMFSADPERRAIAEAEYVKQHKRAPARTWDFDLIEKRLKKKKKNASN